MSMLPYDTGFWFDSVISTTSRVYESPSRPLWMMRMAIVSP